MNKLLPILLVVVLSGCGGEVKSPLENCADVAVNLYLLTERQIDSIELSDDEYKKKWKSVTLREIHKNIAKEKMALRDLALKGKLKNKQYETKFKKCERERKRYPETFDAKWK